MYDWNDPKLFILFIYLMIIYYHRHYNEVTSLNIYVYYHRAREKARENISL